MDSDLFNKIEASIRRDPTRSNRMIGRGIRMAAGGRANATMAAEVRESMGEAPEEKKQPQQKGQEMANTVSVSDLLKKHDMIGIAEGIIKAIPSGQVMPDEALRVELKLGADRWRRAKGSSRLQGYWTMLPDKTTVWGSRRTIESLEEQIKEILI